MLERIIVGVNDSEEAADAIALAHYLARRTGARVTALAAYELDSLPREEHPAALERESESLFGLVSTAFHDVESETRAVSGSSPAPALTEAAEEGGAGLLVVGSTRRALLGRLFPGSVAERLLHGAPCPVAVAPRGYARRRHIGVGLIGVGYLDTQEARLALAEAKDLAADLDAQLRLITVLGRDRRDGPPDGPAGEMETGLLAAEAGLEPGPDHEAVLLEGDPAAALAEQGIELDVLIVGSRGYGPLGRTLLGAVSAEVMRTAPCPVIVVPRAAAPAVAAAPA